MTLDQSAISQFVLPPDDALRDGLQGLLSTWSGTSHQVTAPEMMTRLVIDGVAYSLYREPWDAELEALLAGLSPREVQVARLAGGGLSAKAIAIELNIKPYTVDTYIRRVYNKLHINTRAALVRFLARRPL